MIRVRAAGAADVPTVARCITLAFKADPIWSVALGGVDRRTDHHETYWRLAVEGGQRFSTVFMADDGAAVSVWIPPGEPELSTAQSAASDRLVRAALDDERYEALQALYQRFERSRAAAPAPSAYLSLLATDPAQRGRGVGQQLLAANLAVFDQDGVATYLESTNPANDHRYERAGFRSIGGFRAVLDDAWVNAMWRPVGGGPSAGEAIG